MRYYEQHFPPTWSATILHRRMWCVVAHITNFLNNLSHNKLKFVVSCACATKSWSVIGRQAKSKYVAESRENSDSIVSSLHGKNHLWFFIWKQNSFYEHCIQILLSSNTILICCSYYHAATTCDATNLKIHGCDWKWSCEYSHWSFPAKIF